MTTTATANKYAYSLNGTNYTPGFKTRREALDAAMEAARRYPYLPQTVFVARTVFGDPRASGHAQRILDTMAEQVREDAEVGEAGNTYLSNVPDEQVKELDESIARTVEGWLKKHDLMPAFFTVESISEHPVPISATTREAVGTNGEVQDLGDSPSPDFT
jgi:hypothetical protein